MRHADERSSLLIVLSQPASAQPAAVVSPCPSRPGPQASWRARFLAPAAYRRTAAGGVIGVLHPFSGREAAMPWAMVVGLRRVAGGCRIGVQLPVRPNGRVAWVDGSTVRLVKTSWRI